MQDRAAPPMASVEKAHAGWRSRGYLPHFDSPETVQHVVFRLADAIPGPVMDALEQVSAAERHDGVAAALRHGHGEQLLTHPWLAALVENALLHFASQRYRLRAWCVMPTHVHVRVEQVQGHRLSNVVHSWKSFTATRANKRLERRGAFWAPEYDDRFMRDEAQLQATRFYVEDNPVRAGLCRTAEDWPFSSAWKGRHHATNDHRSRDRSARTEVTST